MEEKELCEVCCEYSIDEKCEHEKDCQLLNILKENEALKQENARLKKKISNLELKMSYMINPNSLGDRHEMGG